MKTRSGEGSNLTYRPSRVNNVEPLGPPGGIVYSSILQKLVTPPSSAPRQHHHTAVLMCRYLVVMAFSVHEGWVKLGKNVICFICDEVSPWRA